MIYRLKKRFEKIKTKKLKNKFKRSLEESEKLRELDINSIHNTWVALQKAKINDYDEFYNVSLYSSIVNRDIAILWNNYILTESKSEKNLYGRLLSMTIIEYLDDINGLLGKKLRLELEENSMNEYIHVFNKVNKSFAKIKTQFNSELRKIRNNSAAHKTKKSKDLLDFTRDEHLESLNEIARIVSEINLILIKLSSQIVIKITEQIKSKK
ncbi:hypothetical protein [Winogradskyella pulchriflava]|uniref:RiboL-PSP-HEPN domain-containing protein n=1 Tax=Winogradskyella pulchriflava TaxID=1110688 RepID=A0ABV6Q524_9FLAO